MAKTRTIDGDEILRRELQDDAFRAEWTRTAFAEAVALRIAAYRAEHGLSQAALGRQLGMTQPAVSRLEAGEHLPTLDTLRRLARVLDMSLLVEIEPDGSLGFVEHPQAS